MVHERHFLPENDKKGNFFPELLVFVIHERLKSALECCSRVYFCQTKTLYVHQVCLLAVN